MAKVTFMDAILSGKRGGSVFSRNKAGYYVRQWVKPINPRTEAQINARTNFGLASNTYHALTNTQKANWGAFAPFYNPKGVSVPSGISGFNAFIALGNLARSCADNPAIFDVLKNGAGSPLAKTDTVFTPSNDAPAHQLMANYQYDGGVAPLIVHPTDLSFTVASDGTVTFDLELPANPSVTSGTGVENPFTDSNGNKYGFQFYMSNPVQQNHNFKANPEIQRLCSIANFELASAPTAITTYGMQGGGNVNPSEYQNFPVTGQKVQITMYQVGEHGMCNKLLTIMTDVA